MSVYAPLCTFIYNYPDILYALVCMHKFQWLNYGSKQGKLDTVYTFLT